jgi:hypothetical protein
LDNEPLSAGPDGDWRSLIPHGDELHKLVNGLFDLYEAYEAAGDVDQMSPEILDRFKVVDGRVPVEIQDGSYDHSLLGQLEELGASVTETRGGRIHGLVPIDKLDDLHHIQDVVYVFSRYGHPNSPYPSYYTPPSNPYFMDEPALCRPGVDEPSSIVIEPAQVQLPQFSLEDLAPSLSPLDTGSLGVVGDSGSTDPAGLAETALAETDSGVSGDDSRVALAQDDLPAIEAAYAEMADVWRDSLSRDLGYRGVGFDTIEAMASSTGRYARRSPVSAVDFLLSMETPW